MRELIDRQALLNKFNESKEIFDCATDDDIVVTIRKDELSMCIAEVVNAPTVEERKHGHWIRIDYHPVGHDFICSECQKSSTGNYNFCSYCGTEMDGVSESE